MRETSADAPAGTGRRDLLKFCAALGGVAALQSGGGLLREAEAAPAGAGAAERIVTSSCNVNCGSRCVLHPHVVDGVVTRIDTDSSGDDTYGQHQIRACLRGRSIRKRLYAPDRLKYPMIRTGKRGEGKFRRASWDEALDLIAARMKDIKSRYGNDSFYLQYCTGALGQIVSKRRVLLARLMDCWGGYLDYYGSYSTAQLSAAMPFVYGTADDNNVVADMANARLVVNFGNNTANTRMSGGGAVYDLIHARTTSKVRYIVIDPTFTDTAAIADEWIPIRPGTDAALVAAMAWVMIQEGLLDQEFLDKYCVGFDEAHMPEGVPGHACYKSYVLGLGPDGVAKTPGWAAAITGIPPETIIRLAREIAQARPCCIVQGWGPQRHFNGEDACRAIALLAILTGNVGVPGGGTGMREGIVPPPFGELPKLANPVKAVIPTFMWTDAITRGPEMTATHDGVHGADRLKAPIKFIWNYAGNTLVNQHADINRTAEILADDTKCEMIVVIDNHLTSSAKFADVLLPGTTNLEETDISQSESVSVMPYMIFCEQAVAPMFECRDIYTICTAIAERLGVRDAFTEGRTREQWLQWVLDQIRPKYPQTPATLADALRMQVMKLPVEGPLHVGLEAFRSDPVTNPLKTPSGKIEIFSKRLWDIAHSWELAPGERIVAIPEFVSEPEGYLSPGRAKFPLQLVTFHYKQRTHSTYGNVPWLKEVAPQELWINPIDAGPRGIGAGDQVRVFNDRGTSFIVAKVTPRVMPGVVLLPEGAWYEPDAQGADHAGSPNVLTSQRPSPLAKGDPMHTSLVDVAKA